MATIQGSQYVAEDKRINAGLNVGFKVGTEASLKSLAADKIQAGVFYLTSDTHRLYIGNKDQTLSPVNQGIITVQSLSTVSNPIPGQFYYITGPDANGQNPNVLATWSGGRWVQMNPDTFIDAVTTDVSGVDGENNAVKIIHTVSQTGGIDNLISNENSAVVIKGGQKIQVKESTATANKIEIATGDYSIKTAGSDNSVDVVLTYTPEGGQVADEEKVTFQPSTGSKIKITQSGNVITLNTNDIQDAATAEKITEAVFHTGDINANPVTTEGFTLELKKSDSASVLAHVNPKITYGKAEYGAGQLTNAFNSGVDTLSVYTIAQTDKLIADSLMSFNALTYCGTVGSTGATVGALPQENVSIGDVYMSTGDKAVKLTVNGKEETYDAGTLFIATSGTKDNNGRPIEGVDGFIPKDTVIWTRVDNYNADTIAGIDTATPNTIKFFNSIKGGARDGATDHLGSFTVITDNAEKNPLTVEDITDRDNAPTEQIIQISHKLSSFDKVSSATVKDEGVTKTLFAGKALGEVTMDAYGHVETITEVPIIVPTEVFDTPVTTVTADHTEDKKKYTAVIAEDVALINSGSGGGVVSSMTVQNKFSSESLVLAVEKETVNGEEKATTMKIDLVWGEF